MTRIQSHRRFHAGAILAMTLLGACQTLPQRETSAPNVAELAGIGLDGSLLWEQTYPELGCTVQAVCGAGDGHGFAAVGLSGYDSLNPDGGWFARVSMTGEVLCRSRLLGGERCIPRSVAAIGTDRYIVSGGLGASDHGIFLTEVSGTGKELVTSIFGDPATRALEGGQGSPVPDNGYLIVGKRFSESAMKPWLSLFDRERTAVWTHAPRFDGNADGSGCVALGPKGSCIAVGAAWAARTNQTFMWVHALSSKGVLAWTRRLDPPAGLAFSWTVSA